MRTTLICRLLSDPSHTIIHYLRFIRDAGKHHNELYIAEAAGFNAAGTASFPGHKFFIREKGNEGNLLDEFVVTAETSIYVYNPFKEDKSGLLNLTKDEIELYSLQKNNLEFGKHYLKFTGREWLSLYPRRHPPRHYMWPADYFGQEHTIETAETHFISLPPNEELRVIQSGANPNNLGVSTDFLTLFLHF